MSTTVTLAEYITRLEGRIETLSHLPGKQGDIVAVAEHDLRNIVEDLKTIEAAA